MCVENPWPTWPREREDGACARRDGAKRKVFQVPPPNAVNKLRHRLGIVEGAREGVESDLGGASCYYTFHPLPRTGATH